MPLSYRRLSCAGRELQPRSAGKSSAMSCRSASQQIPTSQYRLLKAVLNHGQTDLGIHFVNRTQMAPEIHLYSKDSASQKPFSSNILNGDLNQGYQLERAKFPDCSPTAHPSAKTVIRYAR